ncbi:MAG: 50S ribosomal protein L21 [Deltaproteobacteria bacterium]|nr:50S ribosomal protein L21 [Deltaproteobacteria bacterium]
MYAVLRTGGKQYKVSSGDMLDVERIVGETGDIIEFPEVLSLIDEDDVKVGTPLLEGATVKGEIIAQKRGKKILVFKSKRRKGYRKRQGHRQELTQLKITEISA